MQATENGSTNNTSPSDKEKQNKSTTSEFKKVPPKPPKRVSFLSTSKEKEKLENNNTNTENLNSLELAANANNSTETRTNSVKQLKSEFVRTNNDSSNVPVVTSWTNHKINNVPNKKERNSTDLQSRLSESQSKIAKLQQSLPTKLSEATVQSLKNKYSPSNFGYPKNLPKTEKPILSRIPSLFPKTSTILKSETKAEEKVEACKTKTNTINSLNELNLKENLNSSENDVITKEKRTFKTELFITPEIDIDKIPVTDKIDLEKKKDKDIEQQQGKNSEVIDVSVKTSENNTSINKICVEKVIKTETFPKIQCSEAVIVESDDSDTVTISDESVKSQENLNLIIKKANGCSETSSSNLTLTELDSVVSESSEMEEGPKKSTKKRSNSFKRIFGFGSSKEKKKPEEGKPVKNGLKRKDGQVDNYENESVFDRSAPQRHTFSGHASLRSNQENIKPGTYGYRSTNDRFYERTNAIYVNQPQENRLNSSLPLGMRYQQQYQSQNEEKINERERLNMNHIQYDLYLAQQTNKRLNSSLNMPVNSSRVDEYVCMDPSDKQNRNDLTQPGFINSQGVNKYIDTTSSSSTCTLESDNQNGLYENAVSRKLSRGSQSDTSYGSSLTRIPSLRQNSIERKQVLQNGDKPYERPKFSNSPEMFITTPKRVQDPQLIKPKAIIPINTERSLPNPYRNNKDDPKNSPVADGYGTSGNDFDSIPRQRTKHSENDFDSIPRQSQKENDYGKPIPAVRRNFNIDSNTNIPRSSADYSEDDLYGTVYDSLSPVGAQLKITKTNVIRTQNKNVEKINPQNISPSLRQNAISSPQNISPSLRQNITSSPQNLSPLRHNSTSSPQNVSPSIRQSPMPNSQNGSPSLRQNSMSPTNLRASPKIEPTKLKLSPNREKLEPRLKSPIDEKLRVQPEKKKEVKKKGEEDVPSHQNLEIEIDYPENNMNAEQNKKEIVEKDTLLLKAKQTEIEPVVPSSPKRNTKIKRSPHVSPVRPQSLPKSPPNVDSTDNAKMTQVSNVRSPITIRTESPISISSSQSIKSSSSSKLPVNSDDLKDLTTTEVYFWEQTNKIGTPPKTNDNKDISPELSPQHVLTQVIVHQQPPVSPRKQEIHGSPRKSKQNSPAPPVSPQKQQNMRNLEAFYWQEIKKLKEKEEQEIYNQQVRFLQRNNSMNLPPAIAQQHRSRSMSPAVNRPRDKRSLSLPREMQPHRINDGVYGYTGKQEMIPEERIQHPYQMYGVVRQPGSLPLQNANFIRGTGQRSTIASGSIQRRSQDEMIYENYFPGVELRHQAKSGYQPIFKRGSLTNPQSRESPPQLNKKVSFTSAQGEEPQAWPTKNGFTQSPPTRRVDKRGENGDDEVFYPDNYQNLPPAVENEKNMQQQNLPNKPAQREPPYGTTQARETVYGTNQTRESLYGATHTKESPYGTAQARESPYGTTPARNEAPSQKNDPIYESRRQGVALKSEHNFNPNLQNIQNANMNINEQYLRKVRSVSVEPLYISRKPPQYPSPDAIYVTKQNDPIYGRTQKQITVNNKVCDIYGQIHEQPNLYGNIQKSGVIYGQLQQNPIPGSPLSLRNQVLNRSDPSFVRGGRLTSSFNDMRHPDAPRRPLPATPVDKVFHRGGMVLVSDTESGSEAGEVQRILQNREKIQRQNENAGPVNEDEASPTLNEAMQAFGVIEKYMKNQNKPKESFMRLNNLKKDLYNDNILFL